MKFVLLFLVEVLLADIDKVVLSREGAFVNVSWTDSDDRNVRKKIFSYNIRKKNITQLILRLLELSLYNIQILFEKLTARAF